MKIVAKYQGHLFDNKHRAELRLRIDNYRHTTYLDELDSEKEYSIEIKEVKSKRSLEQNKFLWSLLQALEKKTRQDVMDWYTFALEETGAKTILIVAPKGSKEILLHSYRAVKPIVKRMIVNPETNKETEGIVYKCYEGSSKFTIQEMNDLLDTVIRYCNEHDIEVEEYRD